MQQVTEILADALISIQTLPDRRITELNGFCFWNLLRSISEAFRCCGSKFICFFSQLLDFTEMFLFFSVWVSIVLNNVTGSVKQFICSDVGVVFLLFRILFLGVFFKLTNIFICINMWSRKDGRVLVHRRMSGPLRLLIVRPELPASLRRDWIVSSLKFSQHTDFFKHLQFVRPSAKTFTCYSYLWNLL